MIDFIMAEFFSLNGLVNLSNIIFLAAFSVRDVFNLRLLSIFAYVVILPYYYFQQEALWPPIFWGVAFIVVNAVRVIILILERRPVVLSDEEENLYQLTFGSLDKREFLKLLSLAEWVDCSPGDVIIEKGKHSSGVMIMTSGDIEAVINEKIRANIRPGQLIGTPEIFGGLDSPVEMVVRAPSRLARWNVGRVREFAASRPELRATLNKIMSADLAGKLRQLEGEITLSP
jgi:CRP-like cAMP-binding protein